MTIPHFDAKHQPLIGNHSIEASAGTGKTYAITLLWLRLLIEEGIAIDAILVSTFTKAATAELSERLLATLHSARQSLPALRAGKEPQGDIEAVIAKALARNPQRPLELELLSWESSFDLAHIKTLHGFCESLIRRHSLELGTDPDLQAEESSPEILRRLVDDFLYRQSDKGSLGEREARDITNILVQELGLDESAIHLPHIREHIPPAEDYEERLRAMFPKAEQALRQHKKIQERYRANAIDKLNQFHHKKTIPFTKGMETALNDLVPNFLSTYEAFMSAKDNERARAIQSLIPLARNHFAQEKNQYGVRNFNDILLVVRNALRDPQQGERIRHAVRQRFHAVIIDECQDSDGVQIEVFTHLFLNNSTEDKRSFMVIGDPKQSIYRFRGADLGSYRALLDHTQHAAAMVTNWRSDALLINDLNKLYAGNPDFADHQGDSPIRYTAVEASAQAQSARLRDPQISDSALLTLWSTADKSKAAAGDLSRQCAAEIQRLLRGDCTLVDRHSGEWRPLQADDIAVLANNRSQLNLVRRQLRRLGIASSMAGRGLGSVFRSPESSDILAWLDALNAAEQGGAKLLHQLLRFVSTPLVGLAGNECLALANDPISQAQWTGELRQAAERLRQHGPLTPLIRLIGDELLRQRVLSSADGERQLSNWRQLGQLLQQYWAEGKQDALSLRQALSRAQTGQHTTADDHLMRLETDLAAVQLSTIHTSKGLEYPIVICPFLWQVKKPQAPYPIVRRRDGALLDLGGASLKDHEAASIRQQEEEQQRLLYVALTRARHRCYMGFAAVPKIRRNLAGAEDSALAQLLHVEGIPHGEWRKFLEDKLNFVDQYQPPTLDQASDSHVVSPLHGQEVDPPPLVIPKQQAIWRTSSFSALSANHDEFTKDHDELSTQPEAATVTLKPGLLADLGGGAILGNRVHDALEQVIGNGRSLDEAVPGEDVNDFKQAIQTILATPIKLPDGESPGTLQELASNAIAELHFLLPVDQISPSDLSRTLLIDPLIAENPQRRLWAEGIAQWPFARLRGFIQGYIDLILCINSRWFVIDYKTNQLANYEHSACEQSMLDHDYLLQGRLYLLALHRHLQQNLDGYRSERDLGGIGYWFVRGFPEQGFWQECPQREAMEALDALFTKGDL